MGHRRISQAVRPSGSPPPEFVLKAGTTVRVIVAGIPDPAQRNLVYQHLVARLAAIECQAGETGIDLVASMEGPSQRELSFIAGGDYNQMGLSQLVARSA